MNCTHCGDPLKPIVGRDYFYCDSCSTLAFPSASDDADDRITPLGEASEAVCPVCASTLCQASIDNSHVLYCEECRGMLVDSEHFAYVIQRRRADRIGPPDEPKPLDPEELGRTIDCPACGRPMEVHPYYGPGNTVIDSCARCRLVWLDPGEMSRIVRAPGRR